jgi:NAD(P)-dependent dehydrogenase (short-subunit alcohol dehydrogenase family)
MIKTDEIFNLNNKCIVITGASSGIGRACAILLSTFNVRIVLIARNQARLDDTVSLLKGKGHLSYSFDLSKVEDISDFTKKHFKELKIDGIIHAAGISPTLPFSFSNYKKLNETLQVNVLASFELTRMLLKFNTNKNLQSIVFIASVVASVGSKGKSMYAISKGALVSGMKSLAIELANQNIRINTISPGVVNTPLTQNSEYRKNDVAMNEVLNQHPLGLGEPLDIAKAALFLLSDQSRWVTGIDLKIDGGYTSK